MIKKFIYILVFIFIAKTSNATGYNVYGLGFYDVKFDGSQSDSAADFLQRYITSHMQWKNVKNNYTFTKAALDSSFVLKEFQKNKKYKERISAFGLPYMLSLSEHKQEILDTILRDKNTLWPTDKEWRDYLLDMEFRLKKNYYNTLLTVR